MCGRSRVVVFNSPKAQSLVVSDACALQVTVQLFSNFVVTLTNRHFLTSSKNYGSIPRNSAEISVEIRKGQFKLFLNNDVQKKKSFSPHPVEVPSVSFRAFPVNRTLSQVTACTLLFYRRGTGTIFQTYYGNASHGKPLYALRNVIRNK